MASSHRKRVRSYNIPGHAHELTFSCFRRLELLSRVRTCRWFVDAMEAARRDHGLALWAYVIMPNHWHLVVWPQGDGELSLYGQWLTVTHVRRWHAHHHTAGTGPVYQGRFKSFPIQADDHFWTVCRYVERNALRANLVKRAEDWRWSSLWHRCQQTQVPWLHEWPLARPADWLKYVNQAETEAEVNALRRSVHRGVPFGEETWQQQTATALGLESSLRGPGRPRKPDTKI